MRAEDISIRDVDSSKAASASEMVHKSFLQLAAQYWELDAQQRFLAESSPEALRRMISGAACSIGAFCGENVVGFLCMPTPDKLRMLFVHPDRLRRGIARRLWEYARTQVELQFPEVKTVELNSTPYAVGFYRAVGFVPISRQFVWSGARVTRMACWLPARSLGAELPL